MPIDGVVRLFVYTNYVTYVFPSKEGPLFLFQVVMADNTQSDVPK